MARQEDLIRGLRAEDLPEKYADLKPILTSIDAAVTALGNALGGQVTYADNIACERIDVQLSHGVAQTVALKKLRRAGSVIGFSAGADTSGAAHAFLLPPICKPTSTEKTAQILAYFTDPTAQRVACTIWLIEDGVVSSKIPVAGFGNPAAEYTTTAGQSIPNTTLTVINFGTLVKDTDSAVTTGAAWKFTCPAGKGGDYLVSACCVWNTSPGTNAALFIYKNGARAAVLFSPIGAAAFGAGTTTAGATIVPLAAGDTLNIQGFQNSGGAVALEVTAVHNRVTIKRLS